MDLPDYPEGKVHAPPYDITETTFCYWMSIDLPGLSASDIFVEIVANELIVCGERKNKRSARAVLPTRTKPQYGKFRRSFALPPTIKTEAIQAVYRDGVLILALPKLSNPSAYHVTVKNEWDGTVREEYQALEWDLVAPSPSVGLFEDGTVVSSPSEEEEIPKEKTDEAA
jgi:HSP20 family molecular chaperone IbpA